MTLLGRRRLIRPNNVAIPVTIADFCRRPSLSRAFTYLISVAKGIFLSSKSFSLSYVLIDGGKYLIASTFSLLSNGSSRRSYQVTVSVSGAGFTIGGVNNGSGHAFVLIFAAVMFVTPISLMKWCSRSGGGCAGDGSRYNLKGVCF